MTINTDNTQRQHTPSGKDILNMEGWGEEREVGQGAKAE
jgi:hypothetical protein